MANTVIDLTPRPEEYRKTLRFLIAHSTNKVDVDWAKGELERVKDARHWKKVVKAEGVQDGQV